MFIRSCRIRLGVALCLAAVTLLAVPAPTVAQPTLPESARRVNVPYRAPSGDFQPAIFWFGKIEGVTNYADVRVWHTDDRLHVVLHVPDRELWYDTASSQPLTQLVASDAVSLMLDLSASGGQTLGSSSYRFVKQFGSARGAFRGTSGAWASQAITFTATDTWRGSAPNNPTWDMGWQVTFEIPFASLGLSGAPARGTMWSLGLALHDRDDQAKTPIADQLWPQNMDALRPATWGQVHFGRPAYTPPTTTVAGTTTVRHGVNGAIVRDAAVGGHSTCGATLNPWTQWGNANYAGYTQFNVQNQWDVADFMCFSKYYVTFPLDSLPAGASIVSARVTLHLFGNAGYTAADAMRSAINALTVHEDWVEGTITWNNAPYAAENISVTWVYPVTATTPAGPYTWDVSYAVAEARRLGKPLRLVFYSTDGSYHSGKYFYTSDSTDWSGTRRPSLEVQWGARVPTPPTNLRVVR